MYLRKLKMLQRSNDKCQIFLLRVKVCPCSIHNFSEPFLNSLSTYIASKFDAVFRNVLQYKIKTTNNATNPNAV